MPITADQITVAQYFEVEANVDSVTEITVNANAEFLLATPIGQNDNRMPTANVRPYLVGTSAALEGTAGAIDIKTSGIVTAMIDDLAVTSAKLGVSSVTSDKVANDAIKTSNIQDIAVTLQKLDPGARTDLGTTTGPTNMIVTCNTGTDATLPAVSFLEAGLMLPADKTKLDSVQVGANDYTHPNHTGDVTSTGDGATVLQDATVATAKIVDANVTLAKLASDAVTNLSTSQAATDITVNCSTGTNAVIPQATSTLSGLVAPLEHDALNPPTMTLVGNPDIATATAKGIAKSSLPTQPAASGSRFIGWDAGGLLAEFDPLALTATSRKADADDLGNQGTGTLAIDWDAGNYDNKQITLTANLALTSFTATRNGKYTLHVVQDGTGFRALDLTAINTSPRLTSVPLNYLAGAVTVLELNYNASTGTWSW